MSNVSSYLKRLSAVEKRTRYTQLEQLSQIRDLSRQEVTEFIYLATPVLNLSKANPSPERDANGNFILNNAVGSAR
jgi:hypothetical protein